MIDFSFFDALIDSAFVINSDREIVYCNESAATLCESSVRRLTKGKKIYDVIEFEDPNLFTMPDGESGKDTPHPYSEIKYKVKTGKEGKLQVAIQPFESPDQPLWVVMVRDVSLEEILHEKNLARLKELEEYSKNLEKMVEERTIELRDANRMLSAIMDSLGQGFLTFSQAGQCSKIFTKACEDILETLPEGKSIEDVLKIEKSEAETFNMWKQAIFSEQLPFESLKDLGPQLFSHSQGRHVTLDFYPIRDEDSSVSDIVLVATDKTSEHEANLALEKEKSYAKMIVKLVSGKKQFALFLESGSNIIQETKKLAMADAAFDHEQAFRLLHTLEGEAATYSVSSLWNASRACQEILEPLKQGEAADLSTLLAEFLESINELDKVFQRFFQDNADLFSMIGLDGKKQIEIDAENIGLLIENLRKRSVPEAELQLICDELLKESLIGNFQHFNDVIQIVAEKEGKQVAPIEFSTDARVYFDHYQDLVATFVHVFRNAVDHGIEPPEEREMMGKSPQGQIRTQFERFQQAETNWLRIKVEDDGQGISTDVFRKKILDEDPGIDADSLSDQEIIQHVFSAGVSSRESIGEFSGRGIGMNAVKDEAEKMGGRAWVESEPGKGTLLVVEVPDLSIELTLKAIA